MQGRDTHTGIFRTAAAASYPDKKRCLWLALMIVSFCPSSSKVGEVDKSVPALPERVPTSSSTLPSPAQHALVPGSSVPTMVPGSSVPTRGAGPPWSLPGSRVPTETSLLRLGCLLLQSQLMGQGRRRKPRKKKNLVCRGLNSETTREVEGRA